MTFRLIFYFEGTLWIHIFRKTRIKKIQNKYLRMIYGRK